MFEFEIFDISLAQITLVVRLDFSNFDPFAVRVVFIYFITNFCVKTEQISPKLS